MRKSFTVLTAVAAVGLLGAGVAAAGGPFSFGLFRDQQLANHSKDLFGVGRPLDASSTRQLTQAAAAADPTKLATLAKGLRARVVTTQGPAVDDQISLWPDSTHPTYLIACNEEGTTTPGLVRIELATGKVSTIVTGTTSCDPTRRTPWGTIVFGEEAGQGGRLYELIDPLHTTGVTLDRTTGTFSGGIGADEPRHPHRARHGRLRGPRHPQRRHHVPRRRRLRPRTEERRPGRRALQVHPGPPLPRDRADHEPLAVALRRPGGLRTPGRPEHQLRTGPRVRLRAVDRAAAGRRTRISRPRVSPPA